MILHLAEHVGHGEVLCRIITKWILRNRKPQLTFLEQIMWKEGFENLTLTGQRKTVNNLPKMLALLLGGIATKQKIPRVTKRWKLFRAIYHPLSKLIQHIEEEFFNDVLHIVVEMNSFWLERMYSEFTVNTIIPHV